MRKTHYPLCLLAIFLGFALALLTPVLAATPLTTWDSEKVAGKSPTQLRKDLPKILFTKRHHLKRPFGVGTFYCWNVFTPGGGVFVFDPAKPDAPAEKIFDATDGVVLDASLSFDAKKVLFSYMRIKRDAKKDKERLGYRGNPDSFHIYEIDLDGENLRQITTGRFHDFNPVYLPDGKIVFSSTRLESYSMCQPGAACALFTMTADGKEITQIEYSTLTSISPHVLDDGKILYMRWEYQDRTLFARQGLWSVNPDGTRVQLFYGNTITNPNVTWQAKPIPGKTNRYLCTFAPHHGNPVGAIGLLDRSKGIENPAALTNLTPEYGYVPSAKDHAGGGPGDQQFAWSYRDPYPVTKDYALVAYGGPAAAKLNRFRIFALDYEGNKAFVCEDEKISCFNPVPVIPRTPPRKIVPYTASGADSAAKEATGTFLVSDIYQGLLEYGVKRGDVKALRVMANVPKWCNMRGKRMWDHDPLISRGSYYVKECFGTVPVETDGSVHFYAPAQREIYFAALDGDGKEISRMSSFTQLMPGERQSCIGCHESRDNVPSPSKSLPQAATRQPSRFTPPPWGKETVLDYARHVQPVFDRRCASASCHGGGNPAAKLDLSGGKCQYFNLSYENLINKNLVDYIWINRGLTGVLKPYETGARVSPLAKHLESNCEGRAKLTDQERRILYTWIEMNVPYYSTYANTRPGTPGSRDAYASAGKAYHAVREAFGLKNVPSSEINLTQPEWSALLQKNLARSAGGWADDAKAKFKNKQDALYLKVLANIREMKKSLDAKPRMDQPGGVPIDSPSDFGGLYSGFAGP